MKKILQLLAREFLRSRGHGRAYGYVAPGARRRRRSLKHHALDALLRRFLR